MMIELPDVLVKKYEIIKKHCLEENKEYFNKFGITTEIKDDYVVMADMMALYRVYHNLDVQRHKLDVQRRGL